MPLPATTPDLTSLDVLLSIAEYGSLGQAGRAHQMSQPAGPIRPGLAIGPGNCRQTCVSGNPMLRKRPRQGLLPLTEQPGEFHPRADSQLLVDSAQVIIDGMRRHKQPPTGLFVTQPLADQLREQFVRSQSGPTNS